MLPFAKFVLFGSVVVAAGLGAVAFLAPDGERSVEPCEETRSESTAPTGKYKAEMLVRTCAWGFGQAAETVDLKVTKLGNDGWFVYVPLEFDSTAEDRGAVPPVARWAGPDALFVIVTSNVRAGTIVSKQLGLTITRTYQKP